MTVAQIIEELKKAPQDATFKTLDEGIFCDVEGKDVVQYDASDHTVWIV